MKSALILGFASVFLTLSSAFAGDACQPIVDALLKDQGALDATGKTLPGTGPKTRTNGELISLANQWKDFDAKIQSSHLEDVTARYQNVLQARDGDTLSPEVETNPQLRLELVDALASYLGDDAAQSLKDVKKNSKLYEIADKQFRLAMKKIADTDMWMAQSYVLNLPSVKQKDPNDPSKMKEVWPDPTKSAYASNTEYRVTSKAEWEKTQTPSRNVDVFSTDAGIQKMTISEVEPNGLVNSSNTSVEFERKGDGCRIKSLTTRGRDFDMPADLDIFVNGLDAENCVSTASAKFVALPILPAALTARVKKAFGEKTQSNAVSEQDGVQSRVETFNSELTVRKTLCSQYAKYLKFAPAGVSGQGRTPANHSTSKSGNGG